MKYFVPIDIRTIKKNPDSGKLESIPTDRTITFKGKELPDFLVDGKNCYITSIKYPGLAVEGTIIDFESIKDDLLNYKSPYFELSIDQQHIELQHEFRPYLFRYENIDIVCDNCGQTVKLNDLESDESWDGENEYYSDTICPKCGTFDCCELEHEKIEDALKRMKAV